MLCSTRHPECVAMEHLLAGPFFATQLSAVHIDVPSAIAPTSDTWPPAPADLHVRSQGSLKPVLIINIVSHGRWGCTGARTQP
jgi:hypothetical protein